MFSSKKDKSNQEDFNPDFGDLDPAGILTMLFKVPYEKRDDNWKKVYFKHLPNAKLSAGEPQIIEGPDGYPYYHLTSPKPGVKYQGFLITQLKDDFLLPEGVGLAINPAKETPDWVFSYGDLVNFHLKNEFYTQSDEWMGYEESILNNPSLVYSDPQENIIPPETRDVLRKYLISFGVEKPQFALITDSSNKKEILVFHLEPHWFKNNEIFDDIANSLTWFLPKQYTYFTSSPDKLMHKLFPI